jgi:hypothetical protein
MLSKFLFIGLGGSGGKTLQFLHQNLELKLKTINKPMPKGWQFLWIDVPSTPDLLDPGTGVKPLPNKYYLPLSGDGLTYSQVDGAIMQNKGGDLYEEMAQWSPDPSRVAVPISDGAGQYRAIGRVVTMSKYHEIGNRIDASMQQMEGAGVVDELKDITRALNFDVDDGAQSREAQIIIVSSLAGGSGAGSIVDVGDIVRAKVTNDSQWSDNSVGVLYTPDVFDGQVNNVSIEANSLFALTEIVSGFYDSKPGVRPISNILPQFGIEKPNDTRRGPRYNFVIGKSNGQISFPTPQDIFKNTGRLLSAWCLDPHITDVIKANVLTNWEAECADVQNVAGLYHPVGPQGVKPGFPLNSMGYSSVSLGREYFREYAVQRISKKAIKHLIRAHWDSAVMAGTKSPQLALEEKTDQMWGYFLENSGLNEVGDNKNQLTDDIRSPNSVNNATVYANKIIDFATEGKDQQKISDWVNDVVASYNYYISQYQSVEDLEQNEQAKKWGSSFGEKFVNHVISTITDAGVGARVALELVKKLEHELEKIIRDLEREKAEYDHFSLAFKNTITENLDSLGNNAKIDSNHTIWDTLRSDLKNPLLYTSESSLRVKSILLIQEFREGVLPGIKKSLNEIIDIAELALDETQLEGKEVALWTEETPSDGLRPSKNEVLIESWREYEDKYNELVTKAYSDSQSWIEAEGKLLKDILTGSEEEGLISVSKEWVLENLDFKDRTQAPQQGDYSVHSQIFDIKDRAEEIILDPEKDFGKYISQPLDEYLSRDQAGSTRVLAERTDKFIQSLNRALDMARPQIKVERRMNQKIHKESLETKLVVSGIPITEEQVKSRVISSLLPHFDNNQNTVDTLFSSSRAKSIQFYAVFETAKDMAVFNSLWETLMKSWSQNRQLPSQLAGMWQWRRTRNLLHSIPLQPEVIDSFIAGWFTAKIMDDIKEEELNSAASINLYLPELDRSIDFPSPLIEQNPRPQDMLATVLLSLPLAIGSYTTGLSDESLKPYERLILLGSSGGSIGSYNTINSELKSFVSENDRDEIIGKLKHWRRNYERLKITPVVENGVYNRFPSTGWELSSKIVEVLDNMINAVERLETQNPEDY